MKEFVSNSKNYLRFEGILITEKNLHFLSFHLILSALLSSAAENFKKFLLVISSVKSN